MSTLLELADIDTILVSNVTRCSSGYSCNLIITDGDGDVVDIRLISPNADVLRAVVGKRFCPPNYKTSAAMRTS